MKHGLLAGPNILTRAKSEFNLRIRYMAFGIIKLSSASDVPSIIQTYREGLSHRVGALL